MFTPLSSGRLKKPSLKSPKNPLPSQLVQQCLGIPKVGGAKAFGEPAVHWGEEVAGLADLALIAPQLGEADSRAQL